MQVSSAPNTANLVPTEWRIAATPDLNRDGYPDLLWQNSTTGEVVYWLMDGITRLDYATLVKKISPAWQLVGSADLDHNGSADLLWQNTTTREVVYWLMDGVTRTSYGTLYSGIPTEWKIVAPR